MTSTRVIMPTIWTTTEKDKFENELEVEEFYSLVERVARTELRETEATKNQCLEQFRTWLTQNPDVDYCLTDDAFLLRFLRAKKYSLPMAQQTLLKYLNMRKRFRYIFHDMDYLDPKVYELFENGYIVPSPCRDKYGRRVIIYNLHNLDPFKYSSTDMARAHLITYETLIEDEATQILGVTHVGDGVGAQTAHVGMWSVNEFATLIKWGEQSFPMRHKAAHIINMPTVFKYVVDFGLSRVSQKLRDRLYVHSTQKTFHEEVDPKILPKEYGGKLDSGKMIELWKKELASKRDRLLSINDCNLLSDKGIIRRRDKVEENEVLGLQGSFRKLEVD